MICFSEVNKAIEASLCNTNENFVGGKNSNNKVPSNMSTIALVITVVIYLLLLLSFGKFLWNNVFVKLVNFANPVDSIWELLGFAILLNLIKT